MNNILLTIPRAICQANLSRSVGPKDSQSVSHSSSVVSALAKAPSLSSADENTIMGICFSHSLLPTKQLVFVLWKVGCFRTTHLFSSRLLRCPIRKNTIQKVTWRNGVLSNWVNDMKRCETCFSNCLTFLLKALFIKRRNRINSL